MICSREEFLLLLQKWMSSSQIAVLSMALGEGSLSGITMARISGNIRNIDEEAGLFVLASDPNNFPVGDFAMVGLDGWNFGYADQR
jgi:hypothetical protein